MNDTPSSNGENSPNKDTRTTRSAAPFPSDPSCAPCVKLLQEILVTDPDARPRQLLSALAPKFVWRPTADGLEVKIPSTVAQPQRRWSRLHPPEEEVITPATPMPATLQATSAASSPPLQTKEPTNTEDNNNSQWMQIICRPCASKGPEAGARAFVMGPTPLSMVVCTNRLFGSSKESRRAEMEEILTHEFMHVYDVRQLQLDLRDCENLAYSEVRAACQAECYNSWAPQACTWSKAQSATRNLFPKLGGWCIRKVFDKAYKDTRPFGNNASDQEHSSR